MALETSSFFEKRSQSANLDDFREILTRKGGSPPLDEDQLDAN
ncbi:hypothetical protein [Agaribacterium haliotis]|nr:hypothetical protein [Agaribacterium haliotis]